MRATEFINEAVGIITKQNATKDAPIGSEFANVKKLGLGSGKPTLLTENRVLIKVSDHFSKRMKERFISDDAVIKTLLAVNLPKVFKQLSTIPIGTKIYFYDQETETKLAMVRKDDTQGKPYYIVTTVMTHAPKSVQAWKYPIVTTDGRLLDNGERLITNENFKDGKVKGKSRPGRVKRAGASCKGSISSLRAKAKKYSGEKGKMYHWCANMKSGKK